jgi:uncharacterized protein YjdB
MNVLKNIIKAGIIIAYIALIIVLILQALTPGQESSAISNSVGDKINDVVTEIDRPEAETVKIQNVDLDYITVSAEKHKEKEITLYLGSSGSINSKITPENTTNKALEYRSGDVSVVSVTADGRIFANAVGITYITVTSNENPELFYTVSVSVIEIKLESIKIGNLPNEFSVGQKHKLEFELTPGNSTEKGVLWESSDGAVLTVDKNGVITANGEGCATVTVRSTANDQIFASVEIEVLPEKVAPVIPVETVNISSSVDTGRIGDTIKLTVKIGPEGAVGYLIWHSSDENVAAVSQNGVVTLRKAGDVTITVSCGDKISDSITIKVKERLSESITLKMESASSTENGYLLKQGQSGKVVATLDEDATVRDIIYASSDSSIAKISSDGTVEALKGGKVTITVSTSYDGETTSETFELTVEPLTLKDTMQNFYYTIRKSIGHFGAFLVLGFLGTLTYYIIFRKKFTGKLLACVVSFISGFAIAGITEILQLPYFTEGRYCSFDDVILDFSGYCTAAIPITLIILIGHLILAPFRDKKS